MPIAAAGGACLSVITIMSGFLVIGLRAGESPLRLAVSPVFCSPNFHLNITRWTGFSAPRGKVVTADAADLSFLAAGRNTKASRWRRVCWGSYAPALAAIQQSGRRLLPCSTVGNSWYSPLTRELLLALRLLMGLRALRDGFTVARLPRPSRTAGPARLLWRRPLATVGRACRRVLAGEPCFHRSGGWFTLAVGERMKLLVRDAWPQISSRAFNFLGAGGPGWALMLPAVALIL